jgi:hypothetical protein
MARIKRAGQLQSFIDAARPEELAGIENAPAPVTQTTKAAPAPQTMDSFNTLQDVGFTAAATAAGMPFVPVTADSSGAIVERVDRYGRTVKVYSSGPQAGTIVGSGGILYEPPQEVYEAPTTGTTRSPGGVAGATVTTTPTGGVTITPGGNMGGDPFDQDAFDIVRGYLRMWNLGSLEGIVRGWIQNKVSSDAALMNLRGQQAYKDRFKGMELREKANLVPIDEATYLTLEDDYDAWARYYGVEGAFGTTREERQTSFANLIGKNVNPNTFKEFVDTVVTRVDRADPAIKQTLNRFYGITDNDLKNYYINPTENIKALQEKVTAAEIGAAGLAQALNITRASAEDLARFGIDRERALIGYERIAGALPEGQKLSGIYREEGIDYSQETAEEEEFKGLESAARKRRRLFSLAEASFAGSGALTQSALGGEAAGQI